MKNLWKISFNHSKNIIDMIIGIIIYLIFGAIAGVLIWLAGAITGWIPLVGDVVSWALRIVGIIVEVWVVIGIILCILATLGIIKKSNKKGSKKRK